MKNLIFLLAFAFVANVPAAKAQTANKADAILGEWLNEKQDARFLIYKSDNKYFGKIVWGTGSETKDVKNPNSKLRNRDLIGLTILEDFEFIKENLWEDGTIYDPKNGKSYDCKLTLKNKNQLDVRGYVGLSLFGRTETWSRVR